MSLQALHYNLQPWIEWSLPSSSRPLQPLQEPCSVPTHLPLAAKQQPSSNEPLEKNRTMHHFIPLEMEVPTKQKSREMLKY